MIKTALKQASYTFKNQYDKLIKDGKLDTYVSMQTSFFEEADNSTLWGLFVNAGYLTVTKEIDLLKGKYCIEIPNCATPRRSQVKTIISNKQKFVKKKVKKIKKTAKK